MVQSPSGSDTLELNDKEIFIVFMNNAECQLTITKYNELLESAHREYWSKSKLPPSTLAFHSAMVELCPKVSTKTEGVHVQASGLSFQT